MTPITDDIERLFENRLLISMSEASAILGIEVKALRGLANAGRIAFVVVGAGMERPRRRFTREHVLAFLSAPTLVAPREGRTIDASRIREAVKRRIAATRS